MRKIQIIGNVTKDAEVRNVAPSRNVINFDVAVNEKWVSNGVKQEKVHYIKCAIWREKTTIAEHIKKGVKLFIEGSPEVDAYINKEGKAVGSVKINVRELEFLGGGQKQEGQANAPSNDDTLVPTPESDLPF